MLATLPSVVAPSGHLCLGCRSRTAELHRTSDGRGRCMSCFLDAVIERLGPVPEPPRRVFGTFAGPHAVLRFRERIGALAAGRSDVEVRELIDELVAGSTRMDAPEQFDGETYRAGEVLGVPLVAVVYRSGEVKTVLTPAQARHNIGSQRRATAALD